jgi:hypothetical protein
MNGAELSIFLELQQIFDRDAGRLAPDYIETARRLLELMEKPCTGPSHGTCSLVDAQRNLFHPQPWAPGVSTG